MMFLTFAFFAKDFKVFAGARRVALMDDLKELGIITFELDVTKQESIDKARRLVVDHNDGKETLDILVNNAGLSMFNRLLICQLKTCNICSTSTISVQYE